MLPASLLTRLPDCWPLLLLMGGATLPVSRPYWQQQALRRRGQPASATVVAVETSDEGDLLHLRFATSTGLVVNWRSGCIAPHQHFVGDTLPLRYLPRHPRCCLLLEDVYSNQLRELLWFYAGLGLLCVVSVVLN